MQQEGDYASVEGEVEGVDKEEFSLRGEGDSPGDE